MTATTKLKPDSKLGWAPGAVWEAAEQTITLTRRVLLYGPPGTGKTHLAVHGGLADGEMVFSKTMTQEMTSHELLGTWMPMPDEETGGQKFVWHDGVAIKAWRMSHDKPVRLVLNEVDRAGPDVQSILYVLVDDLKTAELTLPTGETIRPGPGFKCVASMNGDPMDLPPALEDRFSVRFNVNEVHPGALMRLPEELRTIAAQGAIETDPARRTSIRSWLAFVELTEKGLPEDVAARAIFADRWKDLLDALKIARADRAKAEPLVVDEDAMSELDALLKGGE